MRSRACVRARACLCVRARVCVRACVFVCARARVCVRVGLCVRVDARAQQDIIVNNKATTFKLLTFICDNVQLRADSILIWRTSQHGITIRPHVAY